MQDWLETGTFLLAEGGTAHPVEGTEHQLGTELVGTALVVVEGRQAGRKVAFNRKQGDLK